jgi:hypothetical protein
MKTQFLFLFAFALAISFASAQNICNGDSCYNHGELNINFAQTALCGNDVIENTEQCDGANMNGLTCSYLGYTSGVLKCSSSCTLDRSGCTYENGNNNNNNGFVTKTTSPSSNSTGSNTDSNNGEDAIDNTNSNSPITGSAIGPVLARLSWAVGILVIIGLVVFFVFRNSTSS